MSLPKKIAAVTGLLASTLIAVSCDGPYYRIVIEEVVPAEDCHQDEDIYDPNLVDPYSEDTNWYIDDMGNIIWKAR